MTQFKTLLMALLATMSITAFAQEATIRKNLAERLPDLPTIEEVSKTSFPGIWELRMPGNRILYTDDKGSYLMLGSLIDTESRTNLTEARIEQLSAIAYADLPLKDAFTLVKGKGTRKMAVFEDPNCGFCKRLHRELAKIDDVTVHVFLIPVLGEDSAEKSRRIWCAKDKAKTYTDWMVGNQPPAAATCDASAIARNSALASKHGINGTPTMIFANNTRVPGFIAADRIETMLKETRAR